MPDIPAYTPLDWYWIVNGSTTQVYSSKTGDYVPVASANYAAWLAAGGVPSRAASEADLGEVLALHSLRPTPVNILDGYQDAHSRKITLEIVAKVLLWCVNEIRTLKGQKPVSAAQFRTFVKGLL